ncbi:MAG TPA: hypothetical protein VNA20_18815 [Frankiaceae bacterium]|nr:hypothetical protein [Frankiaceae bacterium]
MTADGLVVLMKDKHIRRRPAESGAVLAHGARCFCLTRGGATGAEMADLLVAARPRILRASALPGPFIFQVHQRGLTRVL